MDIPVIILTFFPGECKIYQDIFQDFLTKSIRFLFVSRFFPEFFYSCRHVPERDFLLRFETLS